MKKIIYLVLILSLFLFCGPKQEKVERIMEDGVEVVLNHIEPYKIKGEPATFILEEKFSIDTERDEIAEAGLTEIWHFDVDSEGNIYFTSYFTRDYGVFKFDKNGNFVKSFGRRGQGPGEIQQPTSIKINSRDEVTIIDIGRKKLLVFDKNGRLAEEIPVSSNIDEINVLKNEKYLIQKRIVEEETPSEYLAQLPLLLCSSEFEEIKELGRQRFPNYDRINRFKGVWPVFTWSVSDGKIFVGNDESRYEINVYDLEGNLVKKIKKEYRHVDIPKEYKKGFLKMLEPYEDKIYFPKDWPPFQYLFSDDEGRLFVMTFEEGLYPGEYMYDIFSPNGIFIARASLGNYGYLEYRGGKGPLDVKAMNNYLYCIKEEESGYKKLVVYNMKWE